MHYLLNCGQLSESVPFKLYTWITLCVMLTAPVVKFWTYKLLRCSPYRCIVPYHSQYLRENLSYLLLFSLTHSPSGRAPHPFPPIKWRDHSINKTDMRKQLQRINFKVGRLHRYLLSQLRTTDVLYPTPPSVRYAASTNMDTMYPLLSLNRLQRPEIRDVMHL